MSFKLNALTGQLDLVSVDTLDIGDTITGGTVGSILFVGTGPVIAQDNANLFYDDANNRAGFGTNAPASVVEINAATATHPGLIIQSTDDSATNMILELQDAAGTGFIGVNGDMPWVLEFNNTGGSVFIGNRAGENDNLSSNQNLFIGDNAGRETTIGAGNVGMGASSLFTNISGGNNVAIGRLSMGLNETGGSNVGIGFNALGDIVAGSNNVAIGSQALEKNLSSFNTGIGGAALANVVTAGLNVGVGYQALFSSVTGIRNVAIGYQSGLRNTGLFNTFIGYQSAEFTTSSNNNVIIGYQAADNLTTGDTNLIIGYDINAQSATASNQMAIGNLLFSEGIDGTGATLSTGNLGVSIVDPDSKIELDTLATDKQGLHIKGVASQTAALFLMTDESDAVFFNSGDGIAGSEVVWNEQQVDIDFRIEGETLDDLLKVDAGSDQVELNGGLVLQTTRVTTTYTILALDNIILGNTDSAGFTATLPAGAQGLTYKIVNSGSSANDLTVAPDGSEHLLGVNSSFTLSDGESLWITFDATDGWY